MRISQGQLPQHLCTPPPSTTHRSSQAKHHATHVCATVMQQHDAFGEPYKLA